MTLTATCHCGATRIEVPSAPDSATECNCTYCAKVGALWGYYAVDQLRVVSRAEGGLYAPSVINEHYFCTSCGMTTHTVSPDYSAADFGSDAIPEGRKAALNLRLLDDFDLSGLPVERLDGRNLW